MWRGFSGMRWPLRVVLRHGDVVADDPRCCDCERGSEDSGPCCVRYRSWRR